MQPCGQDVRYAARQLLKNPGFTAVAVLTIGLGIGACVSIFSVANAMFLRDRPYREPDRLVWAWQRNVTRRESWLQVSAPNFVDWQRQARSFEQLAAFGSWAPDLEPVGADSAPAERISAGSVTINLFATLGVQPLVGRTFLPEDERSQVAVLSHRLWQTRFQGDPNVLHRTVRLSGTDYTVIGVMPPEFHFPPEPEPDVLWMPRAFDGKQLAETERGHRRGESPLGKRLKVLPPEYGSSDHGKEHLLEIIGVAGDVRGNPGQEPSAMIYIPFAQNPTWDLALAIRTALEPAQMAPAIRQAVATLDPRLPVVSLRTMPQHIRDALADDYVQVVLWTWFAGVALSLAAIGIYGVLSFSVARRTRDIAVHMALGAGRSTVLRQVMARGLSLTFAGLALGLGLSWLAWRVVSSRLYVGAPLEPLATAGVALALLAVAAVACFVPARRATKVEPMEALRYE
jgi:hypothetical protein